MTVDQLEEIIKNAAQAYYAGQPIMSDMQFDRYVAWLQAANPNSEVLNKTGWGYDPKTAPGDKVRHMHGGMQSIANKPRDIANIPSQLRQNVRISAKLDGLSGKLEFVDGKFVRCSTRGDGEVGIDKTDKFQAIIDRYGEPQLPSNFTGEIRGEFVISQANWDKMVSAGTSKKNARNTASGIVNASSVTEDIQYLDFIPYKVIWDKNNVFSTTLVDDMGDCEFCKYFPGYPQLPHTLYTQFYSQEELVDMYNGWDMMWPCDGVVITNNTVRKGSDGVRIYDEVAFKFETLRKSSVVKSIDWQISKQGILAPVANVEPVEIDGATVSRVTLHNVAFVEATGVCVGAEIDIMRSGGVIPKFMGVVSLPETTSEPIPKVCPVCGSELNRIGAFLKCTNIGCGNVDYQNLKCWFNQLGRVDGIAEATEFSFFERFRIGSIDDLYAKHFEDVQLNALRSESVYASKFVQSILLMISGKHSVEKSLLALNIPRIGDISAKKISENKGCVTCIKQMCEELSEHGDVAIATEVNFIEAIRVICGDATADSFKDNFYKLRNYWKYISSNIVIPELSELSSISPAEMIPVCITGKLSMPRKELVALLNKAGYVVKEDVTKKVKYLITNELSGTSSKHKAADKLNTPKVTEAQIIDMCTSKLEA